MSAPDDSYRTAPTKELIDDLLDNRPEVYQSAKAELLVRLANTKKERLIELVAMEAKHSNASEYLARQIVSVTIRQNTNYDNHSRAEIISTTLPVFGSIFSLERLGLRFRKKAQLSSFRLASMDDRRARLRRFARLARDCSLRNSCNFVGMTRRQQNQPGVRSVRGTQLRLSGSSKRGAWCPA